MLKILQNNKLADGMMVVGFGLLAVGIAINFQNQKKSEAKVEVITENEWQTLGSAPTITIVNSKEDGQTHRSAPTNKINLNRADLTELEKLEGVGPKMAENIIQYRTENGGFKNMEEIKLVKGIGDKKYEKIKDDIEI